MNKLILATTSAIIFSFISSASANASDSLAGSQSDFEAAKSSSLSFVERYSDNAELYVSASAFIADTQFDSNESGDFDLRLGVRLYDDQRRGGMSVEGHYLTTDFIGGDLNGYGLGAYVNSVLPFQRHTLFSFGLGTTVFSADNEPENFDKVGGFIEGAVAISAYQSEAFDLRLRASHRSYMNTDSPLRSQAALGAEIAF